MEDDNMSSDCDSDGGDGDGRGGGGCGGLFGGLGGLVTGSNGLSGGLWRPSAQPADPCYRCGKRVYPVERVDVGVLFHRRCFRSRATCLSHLPLAHVQRTRREWGQEMSSAALTRTGKMT
nr:hypothetical protein BaRGS_014748 [Batillaria attramentaria]KAG5713331.1 hypothetical protein BaRGS_007858 [Batillaria attramentaria]